MSETGPERYEVVWNAGSFDIRDNIKQICLGKCGTWLELKELAKKMNGGPIPSGRSDGDEPR